MVTVLFCYLVKSLYLIDFAGFLPSRRRVVGEKSLTGYLFGKGEKRKSPRSCYASRGHGREHGIRTHEPFMAVTRFPKDLDVLKSLCFKGFII